MTETVIIAPPTFTTKTVNQSLHNNLKQLTQ